jgi:preprotein translocase subunit SecD
MRTITFVLAFLFALVSASAHADRAAVDLRVVVADNGTPFPARDGAALRLGPSLLTAPFAIADVHATGAEVQLTLAPATARSFAALTAAHRGDKLAIVVDGVVQSAPVVRDAITGGKVSITLRSPDDAAALARSLTKR